MLIYKVKITNANIKDENSSDNLIELITFL